MKINSLLETFLRIVLSSKMTNNSNNNNNRNSNLDGKWRFLAGLNVVVGGTVLIVQVIIHFITYARIQIM